MTKTRASDRPPPCSLSQRCKQQHNANKAHRHNGDKAQPPARRRTEKHVKAHNGLSVLQSIWNTAMFRCGQKAIKKKIKEEACKEDQPVLPKIIWSPPRGSSVYLAHISNKERSDEVSPPNAADPPSAAEENMETAGSEFKVSTKRKKTTKKKIVGTSCWQTSLL